MQPGLTETLSVTLINQIIDELNRTLSSDPEFSVQDLLAPFEDASVAPSLAGELVRHHFELQQRADPQVTPAEYLERFPRHRPFEQALQPAVPTRQSHGETRPGDAPRPDAADVVAEFSGGPLASLPEELQRILRSRMTLVSFARNDFVLEQGSGADGLFVVTSGTLRIESTTADGQTLPLARVGPGQVVGEMSLVGLTQRTASAVACEPVTALRLSAADFHELRQAHAEIAQAITEVVAARLGTEAYDALSSKLFNGYRIARRIGRGGQSVVYEALHDASQRRVALKMMSHRLVYEPHARELFASEAKIVSGFDHPGIPQVYERFDDFGTSFMAIEYIEGTPLSERIGGRTRFSEEALQAIAGQLAGALDYAHGQGIVHRDVKPANCMLTPGGAVKLLDFGLSVFYSTHRSPAGSVVGTLAYMAPEQVSGQPPTPAGDWFSLGVMLYELATFERLIQPRNLLQLSGLFRNWDAEAIARRLDEGSFLRPLLVQLLQVDPAARRFDSEALKRLARPVG